MAYSRLYGYDVEVREASTYPGTSFGWGSATVAYNGSGVTDYYRYPTLAYDSNSKIWISVSKYESDSFSDKFVLLGSDDVYENYDEFKEACTLIPDLQKWIDEGCDHAEEEGYVICIVNIVDLKELN